VVKVKLRLLSLTKEVVESAGHGMNNDVITAMKNWLMKTVEPKVKGAEK